MKSPIKGLFVILAIVMSFVLVQGVWARADILIEELYGTAISVDNREIGIDENEDGTIDFTVSHMGPQRYWEDCGISYPSIGADLIIKAYDSLNGYVGVSICYQNIPEPEPCIELRDSETLKPLWVQHPETTDLSDTAAEATGDCCPDCPDCGDCEPIPNDYSSPGPHKKDF
jgi:hypothetical protein